MNLHVFTDFLIVLTSALVIVTLFHKIKIPTVVGFLLAGVLIGPHGLRLIEDVPGAQLISELGVIFLMFTIGLEFSFGKLKELRRNLLLIGAVQVTLTSLCVFLFSFYILDKTVQNSILWGFLISLSSTAVVLKLLQDKRDLETLHGTASLSILLSQDLLVIPMLMILPALTPDRSLESMFEVSTLIRVVTKIFIVLALVFIFVRKAIPIIFEKIVDTNSRELFFFFILVLCFGTSYLFESYSLSASLGAFVGGLLIAESPYGRQATSDFLPFRDNFLGLFFISIGMLLNVPFIFSKFPQFLLLGTAFFAIKLSVIYFTLRMNKITHSISLMCALLLFQVGEFSFVLSNQAAKIGILSPTDNQFFIAISVISLILTPILFKRAPQISLNPQVAAFFPKKFPSFSGPSGLKEIHEKIALKEHVIIVGYGLAGQSLAGCLEILEIPYKIIEFNPASFRQHLKKDNILFGNAADPEILEKADLLHARMVVVSASGRSEQMQNIVDAVRKIRPNIEIILRLQYQRNALKVQTDPNLHVIVAEFETSQEILAQTLRSFGISNEGIDTHLNDARKKSSGLPSLS